MTRNFCGYLDFEGSVNPSVLNQMVEKPQFGQQYQVKTFRDSPIHLASLSSKKLSGSVESAFLEKLGKDYQVVAFAMLFNQEELSIGLFIAHFESQASFGC